LNIKNTNALIDDVLQFLTITPYPIDADGKESPLLTFNEHYFPNINDIRFNIPKHSPESH
jgi:hypothetical protein